MKESVLRIRALRVLEYVDWADAILTEPLVVKNSHVLMPSVPGTGIRWDEKAVKKYLA